MQFLIARFQTAKPPLAKLNIKVKAALTQLAQAHLLPDNTSTSPKPTLQPSEPLLPWTVPRNHLPMKPNWIYRFCNPGNSSYRGDITFSFCQC